MKTESYRPTVINHMLKRTATDAYEKAKNLHYNAFAQTFIN